MQCCIVYVTHFECLFNNNWLTRFNSGLNKSSTGITEKTAANQHDTKQFSPPVKADREFLTINSVCVCPKTHVFYRLCGQWLSAGCNAVIQLTFQLINSLWMDFLQHTVHLLSLLNPSVQSCTKRRVLPTFKLWLTFFCGAQKEMLMLTIN